MVWGKDCQIGGVATIGGIYCVISSILSILAPLIILAAVAMAIYAGAQMILGGEDPKKYAAARDTLTWSVVGVIGIGLAWLILVLIERLTGALVTQLKFGN